MQYTRDQQCAQENFLNFVNVSNDEQFYGIYGYSGTGKTFIIMDTLVHLITNKLLSNVALVAPTNKAVNVMKVQFEKYLFKIYHMFNQNFNEKINFDDVIENLANNDIIIEFCTIHKLLNFETDYTIDGQMIFTNSNVSDIDKYELIIIDECSMLPLKIIDDIFNSIQNNKKQKIIFSGDCAQLPPVGEKQCILFTANHDDYPYELYLQYYNTAHENVYKYKYDLLLKTILNIKHVNMQHVIRNNNTNLISLCNKIRETKSLCDLKLKKYFDNVKCFAYKNNNEKIDSEWFLRFADYIANDKNAVMLTWTNKQCNIYNTAIRNLIFKKINKIEKYAIGDILMFIDYHNIKRDDKENKFHASEQIKIVGLTTVKKKITTFTKNLTNSVKVKTELDKVFNMINTEYKCWTLNVKKILGENIYTIYIIHDDDIKKYNTDKEIIINMISKLKSKCDEKTIKKIWKEYNNIFINPFANVIYGYCITCHKSQGSTFVNIFVDMNDIIKNKNEDEMKKCLYTAISRSSDEMHLLL